MKSLPGQEASGHPGAAFNWPLPPESFVVALGTSLISRLVRFV